ncbi:hypothetical protein BKA70DRAFT_1568414 [Coprinopsis sp. MPI-PUGE-AT-0042]|nr:hypothetical protein BKA70DRAFT_1568414 [Coprinopsis sp. MPI-PUGE-AT-0042]
MALPRMPPQLQELTRSVIKDDWKAEHLKTALGYLELKDAPKRLTDEKALQATQNAFGALGYLTMTMEYCETHPVEKESAFAMILDQLEGVFAWTILVSRLKSPLATTNDQLHSAAQTVRLLAGMNRAAEVLVFSSERALDILLSVWTTRMEGKKKNAAFAVPRAAGCQISSLLHEFLLDNEGCQRLLARLSSSNSLRADFFEAMAFRIRHVREMRTTGTDPGVVKGHFRTLIDCYDQLQSFLIARVASRPSLRLIAETLVMLQLDYTTRGRAQLLEHGHVVERVAQPHCLPGLIDTGIVSLIVSTIKKASHLSSKGQTDPWAHTALRALRHACFFPRSLWALKPELSQLQFQLSSSSFGTRSSAAAWDALVSAWAFNMKLLMDVYQGPPECPVICDNLEHPLQSETICTESKTCSACHMVVYCSPACQKNDWETRHRRECRELRQVNLKRSLQGVHYTFKIREFQTHVAAETFRSRFPDIEKQHQRQLRSHHPHEIMTVMDCTSDEGQATVHLSPVREHFSRTRRAGDSPALEERTREIYERLMAKKAPQTRLVESVIRWDDKWDVVFFLELELVAQTSPGISPLPVSCNVVRSVVRIRVA